MRATVDLRAVNHRFLDLKLRGTLAPALEEAIAAKIRALIERGALSVSINLTGAGAAATTRIDCDAAKRAHGQLAALAAELGTEPPSLGMVLAQPGVTITAEPVDDAPVLAAVDAALAQLDQMRLGEGAALQAELLARLDWLAQLRLRISELAEAVPAQQLRRLTERLAKLGLAVGGDDSGAAAGQRGRSDVDPQRLAQEVAILADRADITEELVRLASHLDQARALISGNGAVGRRLDFLVQELGREINTIGSKSAAAEITAAVVEAKATLEKLREQVQNVE